MQGTGCRLAPLGKTSIEVQKTMLQMIGSGVRAGEGVGLRVPFHSKENREKSFCRNVQARGGRYGLWTWLPVFQHSSTMVQITKRTWNVTKIGTSLISDLSQ